MSKWFFINFVVLLFVAWKVTTGHFGFHVLLGACGVLLVFYNWTRHAVYSTIRSNISRKRKRKYAKLTKKLRKYHQWVGFSAIGIIFLHALFVLFHFHLQLNNLKMMSGLLAMASLAGVVITGWMRKKQKTRHRHIVHLTYGFVMFALVILHVVL